MCWIVWDNRVMEFPKSCFTELCIRNAHFTRNAMAMDLSKLTSFVNLTHVPAQVS